MTRTISWNGIYDYHQIASSGVIERQNAKCKMQNAKCKRQKGLDASLTLQDMDFNF